MEPLAIVRAVCFARICLAAVLLENLSMGCFVWRFKGDPNIIYPFLSMLATLPRMVLIMIFIRNIRGRYEQEFPDGRLVGSRALRLWSLFSVALSVWYLVTLLLTHDRAFWHLLLVLIASNVHISLSLCCFLATSKGPPHLAVKTFEIHRGETRELSLQFGANCSICLCDLNKGQWVGQLPCGHAFHEQCIREWLSRKDCCPMRCTRATATTHRVGLEGDAREAVSQADDGGTVSEASSEVVPPTGRGAAAVVAAATRRLSWAVRWLWRAEWRSAGRWASELAAEGRGPAPLPEAAEGWAEEQVSADLGTGMARVALHPEGINEVPEPAPPPESDPDIVFV